MKRKKTKPMDGADTRQFFWLDSSYVTIYENI